MALISPEDRARAVTAPALANEPKADSTGGVIPYNNPPALMAYYAGVFSIIPVFGFFFGIAGLWLGIVGLRRRKKHPVIRGSVHAWIGIIGGSLSIAVHLALAILLVVTTR